MRSLPERGAPSHRQCPLFALHRPFYSLFRRKTFGEERGVIPPKRGGPTRSLLGRGYGKQSFAEGRCVVFPYRSPFPHGHAGGG
ncbi:hypothetical protein HMPREF0262_02596, partial [Clostridium sp. ATCC 29733]